MATIASPQRSAINTIADPTQSLQTFQLTDLARFTREGSYSSTASEDFHLFYVGRDDVHDLLKYVLSRVSVSLILNMFGYDDDELNDILMTLAEDPNVTTMYTLDRSQAGGVHEKTILSSDVAKNPEAYNASFVIGQSATHQISHTKGWVADARVGGEGSTNWSVSGEGTFVVAGAAGGPGYKAQNNTQSIFTSQDDMARFQAELIAEHNIAKSQGGDLTAKARATPTTRTSTKKRGSVARATTKKRRSAVKATTKKRRSAAKAPAKKRRSAAKAPAKRRRSVAARAR
jgi:hypothetical protein